MNEFSTNAKFALVIGESTEAYGPDKTKNWLSFLASLQHNVRPSEATKKIHDNIWLIPLDTEMPFLGKLLEWGCGVGKIRLRILFLDEEPDWIMCPAPAKPKEEPTA